MRERSVWAGVTVYAFFSILRVGNRRTGRHCKDKWATALAVLLMAAGFWAGGTPALSGPANGGAAFPRQIDRTILAIYDGMREAAPDRTAIHAYAEMPLNHLGFRLVWWDLRDGVPDPQTTAAHRRVLTWFQLPLDEPDAYIDWAAAAAASGSRFVILGELGAPFEAPYLDRINELLGAQDLYAPGRFMTVTYRTTVLSKDSGVMDFEAGLDPVLPGYPVLVELSPQVRPHLVVRDNGRRHTPRSAVVTSGPGGGFAPNGYVLRYEPAVDRMQWLINPFAFFASAFGAKRMPAPDVTTVSGRRIYFSHIDGDGWNNISVIARYRQDGVLSASVVARELIEPYPDLPVSVALIAGDVDPALGEVTGARAVARELFALPQVEVASHSYTHPYNWTFYRQYDRVAEEKLIALARGEEQPKPYQAVLDSLADWFGIKALRASESRYISGSDELPRAYLVAPFDLDQEIAGSIAVAEALAPDGKKPALFQWSGETNPFPAAVRATRAAGVPNINGGDSRLDAEFPSIAYVPPIGRKVGDELQIYAVNSNENTYTNDWRGPYYAFRYLERTLDNTEQPRRLKGYNLYYHMYSGEKLTALEAVKHHLDRARELPLNPIAASFYVRMAEGFYTTRITEVAPGVFAIAERGELQTVRFDDAGALTVDLARSRGVVGANRHGDALYVALDAAVDEPMVAVTDTVGEGEPGALLLSSRWRFSDLRRGGCGFSATATGYGKGAMRWGGLDTGRYRVGAVRDGRELWAREATSVDGVLEVEVAADAIEPLRVEVACIGRQEASP